MKNSKSLRLSLSFIIILAFCFSFYSFAPSAKFQMMNPVVIKRLDDGALYLKGCVNLKFKNQISSFGKSTFGIDKLDKSLANFEPAEVKQIFPADKLKKNLIGDNELVKIFSLKYNYDIDPGELSKKLFDENKDILEWIEPDYVYTSDFTPNDPSISYQWFLNKISAYTAWDVIQGDTNVVIGMVDTGCDFDHPDLAANIKRNWSENPSDSLDNDENGYVDDYRGWDFAGAHYQTIIEDNDPSIYGSNCDHGSHTSGCASEVSNNAIGGAGIGFKSKLLICKHGADDDYTGGGTSYLYHTDYGIMYSYQNGAKVINCSFGSTNSSQFTQTIINSAWANGVIVVASAGNDGQNVPRYPASYNNVISVAATNSSDVKAYFSNYHSTVDICAPGVSIYSTLWNNVYTYYDGTSMSSPIVAGTVALLWAKFPSYTASQIVNKLLTGVDDISAYNPGYTGMLGSGRVNAYKCLLGGGTGITNYNEKIPDNFAISQNFPNPFNPVTNINFDIQKGNIVKLNIYDISGKQVAVLLNEFKAPGKYTYTFDASNLSSGIYYYRISAGDFTDTKKMMLVK